MNLQKLDLRKHFHLDHYLGTDGCQTIFKIIEVQPRKITAERAPSGDYNFALGQTTDLNVSDEQGENVKVEVKCIELTAKTFTFELE